MPTPEELAAALEWLSRSNEERDDLLAMRRQRQLTDDHVADAARPRKLRESHGQVIDVSSRLPDTGA
ncbi:hypothetical protein ABZX92_39800 [Lentzea sp. NPDC006480]|uniref:hypothetical protein n=1 Tax=Lentzea sp. NPDC006480 TaxID=3157176 RepID=UPI0033B3C638